MNQKYKYTLSDFINSDAIKDIANKDSFIKAYKSKIECGIYCGFDTTADSLHLGNYIQLVTLKKLKLLGFVPIVVIGEATAMIGDPSGKNAERILQSKSIISNNAKKIEYLTKKIITDCIFVNNNLWLSEMNFIQTLRDYGKYFNIASMIKKQNISERLSTGISFTEFSYVILQSIDFYNLYIRHNCYGQIGGSDQWGNIVSGIDLISKIGLKSNDAIPPFGITINLLVDSSGRKFGKTEKNSAIWIEKDRTSPYKLYQFIYNQPDKIIRKLFEYFTTYPMKKLDDIMSVHKKNLKLRYAQSELAKDIILNLYDRNTLNKIIKISDSLFNNNINQLSIDEFHSLAETIKINKVNDLNMRFLEMLKKFNIVLNSHELDDIISKKSLIINDVVINNRIINLFKEIKPIFKNYYFVKKGKKNFYIILK